MLTKLILFTSSRAEYNTNITQLLTAMKIKMVVVSGGELFYCSNKTKIRLLTVSCNTIRPHTAPATYTFSSCAACHLFSAARLNR